jgi:hypothetical protein
MRSPVLGITVFGLLCFALALSVQAQTFTQLVDLAKTAAIGAEGVVQGSDSNFTEQPTGAVPAARALFLD